MRATSPEPNCSSTAGSRKSSATASKSKQDSESQVQEVCHDIAFSRICQTSTDRDRRLRRQSQGRARHPLRTSPRIPILKTVAFPQLIPLWENWRMRCTKTPRLAAPGLVLAAVSLAVSANATTPVPAGSRPIVVAQAMIPRTGMMDAQNPMPMKERYLKRFPQPARVGDLIGMPVLDLYSKTLGYVRKVVRTPAGEIEFIVGYSQWWGWFGRPVAVPLEALGIEGGHLVSLDMSPSKYAAAPTWHDTDAKPLPADATVRVALSRS